MKKAGGTTRSFPAWREGVAPSDMVQDYEPYRPPRVTAASWLYKVWKHGQNTKLRLKKYDKKTNLWTHICYLVVFIVALPDGKHDGVRMVAQEH